MLTVSLNNDNNCIISSGLLDMSPVVNSEKILKHTRKMKRQEEPEVVDKSTGSLFTDEDFEVVSKLHFVNSRRAVILKD